MTDVTVTSDQLVEAIEKALKAHDVPAVGELLHSLALLDPYRAEEVRDTLLVAVEIAKARAAVHDGTPDSGTEAR